MNKLKDLTGQKFEKLTVIKRVENDKNNRVQYLCKCECGSIKIIRGSSLTSGNTKSCGCNFGRKKTQSFYGTRLYRIWANIKSRCTNPKYIRFEDYGGRGINICDEWKEFNNFKDWSLKHNYSDALQIDRINNNGNYGPSNCHWVKPFENSRNKRNNLFFTYKDTTLCLKDWALKLNIDYILLYNRIVIRKWSFEKAINTPIMTNRRKKSA